MEQKEFIHIRKKLEKTQQQLAHLLGLSIKAVHSYEQGWRNIPDHVERQMLFLLTRKLTHSLKIDCWDLRGCPEEKKSHCPAWEFQEGHACWFVNGNICGGSPRKSWKEKIAMCRNCIAFIMQLS